MFVSLPWFGRIKKPGFAPELQSQQYVIKAVDNDFLLWNVVVHHWFSCYWIGVDPKISFRTAHENQKFAISCLFCGTILIPPRNYQSRTYHFRSPIFFRYWVALHKYTPQKHNSKFLIAVMNFIFSVRYLCMWFVDFYDFRFGMASSRTKNYINTSFWSF